METEEMKKCVAGCMAFDGGEIKHHPECGFYKKSLSRYYDELQQKTQQQQQLIERANKLFKKIIELEPLWMPIWTEDPPVEHLDEAIALRSISKRCQMLIEKIEAETLLKETQR